VLNKGKPPHTFKELKKEILEQWEPPNKGMEAAKEMIRLKHKIGEGGFNEYSSQFYVLWSHMKISSS